MTPRDRPELRELLLKALEESAPSAFIQEMEAGVFLIDGEFRLADVADRLFEMLEKHL